MMIRSTANMNAHGDPTALAMALAKWRNFSFGDDARAGSGDELPVGMRPLLSGEFIVNYITQGPCHPIFTMWQLNFPHPFLLIFPMIPAVQPLQRARRGRQ